MSLSPEGHRRLLHDLWLAGMKMPNFRCTMVPLPRPRNWPSETTLNTNRLNGRPADWFDHLSHNPPAARRSPARLKEAVSWWFARAETRRIIERMMQP